MTETLKQSSAQTGKRWYFRFGLRSLFVLILLASIAFSLYHWWDSTKEQRWLIRNIQARYLFSEQLRLMLCSLIWKDPHHPLVKEFGIPKCPPEEVTMTRELNSILHLETIEEEHQTATYFRSISHSPRAYSEKSLIFESPKNETRHVFVYSSNERMRFGFPRPQVIILTDQEFNILTYKKWRREVDLENLEIANVAEGTQLKIFSSSTCSCIRGEKVFSTYLFSITDDQIFLISKDSKTAYFDSSTLKWKFPEEEKREMDITKVDFFQDE